MTAQSKRTKTIIVIASVLIVMVAFTPPLREMWLRFLDSATNLVQIQNHTVEGKVPKEVTLVKDTSATISKVPTPVSVKNGGGSSKAQKIVSPQKGTPLQSQEMSTQTVTTSVTSSRNAAVAKKVGSEPSATNLRVKENENQAAEANALGPYSIALKVICEDKDGFGIPPTIRCP